MGDGTWVNVGGNQAVTTGGNPSADQNGAPPYDDADGRQSWVIALPLLILLLILKSNRSIR